MRIRHRILWSFTRALTLALPLAFAAGCYQEAKSAPKKPSEVPIDTLSSRREAKRPDPNEGEDVTTPPPEALAANGGGGDDFVGGNGGGGGGGGGGGRVGVRRAGGGGGSRLTMGQCNQMMDKYVELVISRNDSPAKGASGKGLEHARNTIKMMVSQDPKFQGFLEECVKNGTRAQHACAVNARDDEEFRQCVTQ